MDGWEAITKPGTKESLRSHYNQIVNSRERCMPTKCKWKEEKNGLFSVAIPKEEYGIIQEKWDKIRKICIEKIRQEKKRSKVNSDMIYIGKGHKKTCHAAI